MPKIEVRGTEITILSAHQEDYISLTDMVKNIELIADTDQYGCEHILVLGKGRKKDSE